MTIDKRLENSSIEPPRDVPTIGAGKVFMEEFGDKSTLVKGLRLAKPAIKVFGKYVAAISEARTRVTEDLIARLCGIIREEQDAHAAVLRKIIADMNAALEADEADWKEKTGVVPPRVTLDNILEVVAWWREQAVKAGIDINTIISTDDDQLLSQLGTWGTSIRGALELLKIQKALRLSTPRRKGAHRAHVIYLLKKELHEHILSMKSALRHADDICTPFKLPRLLQKDLADRIGETPSSVSRAIHQGHDRELKFLMQHMDDPDFIRKYRR